MKLRDFVEIVSKLDPEKSVLVTKAQDEHDGLAREAEIKIVHGQVVVFPLKRW